MYELIQIDENCLYGLDVIFEDNMLLWKKVL